MGNGTGGYSTDASATWTAFALNPPVPEPKAAIGPIAVSADGASWVCSIAKGTAQITTDKSASWNAVQGLPPGAVVVADRASAGTCYGFDAANGKLFVSNNGGSSFAPAGTVAGKYTAMAATPGLAGHLWFSGKDGLLRSTNGGTTCTRIAGVASSTGIGFGKAAPGHSYPALYLSGLIGAWNGLFRSDDEGATWVRLNDENHQWGWAGKAITGDPRVYGRVYVGTNGRGVLWGEPTAP